MRNIALLLSTIIFFAILTLAVYYMSNRLSRYFQLSHKLLFWIIAIGLVISLTGIMYVMRSNATGFFSHVIANVSSIGMGLLLIMLMSTLATDLFRLIIKLEPVIYGIILVSATAMLTIYGLWNAQDTRVIPLELRVKGLDKEIRIMQYSDVHLGHFWGKKTLERLVKMTLEENVDAVVITGDLFDGRTRLDKETIEPLSLLNVPVYFVQGNHDGYTGADTIKKMLSDNGVIVLSNEVADLKGIQIVGLDYMLAEEGGTDMMHAPLEGNTIKSILPTLNIDREKPSILLHHNPIGAEYADAAGIDLYLAGHTHGGQIFPITLINNKIFTYNKGLYESGNTKIYVSQGSGSFGPPMRLGTKSEITLITLRPANLN